MVRNPLSSDYTTGTKNLGLKIGEITGTKKSIFSPGWCYQLKLIFSPGWCYQLKLKMVAAVSVGHYFFLSFFFSPFAHYKSRTSLL